MENTVITASSDDRELGHAPDLQPPRSSSYRRRRILLTAVAVAMASVLKLWLIAGDECTVRAAKHDQTRFAEMAGHLMDGEWLGPYNEMTLIREPGYPLWMLFVSQLGIPLRLGTECLYLTCSAAFAVAIAISGRWNRVTLGLIVFGFLAFWPNMTFSNVEVRAETLFTPMLLLIGAGMTASTAVEAQASQLFGGTCLAV